MSRITVVFPVTVILSRNYVIEITTYFHELIKTVRKFS